MREQHDTRMLEQVVSAASERMAAPARELNAASSRLTEKTAAEAHVEVTRADAKARAQDVFARTLRTVATLLAVAVLALALGFAGRMLLQGYFGSMPVTAEAASTAAGPAPGAGAPVWPTQPQPTGTTQAEEAVVTTNFTLFREKVVKIGAREFQVNAGHHFDKGTDTEFQRAWCYVVVPSGQTTLKLTLGTKTPVASPVAQRPTTEEKQKSNLTDANIRTLFNACPWLDGNPDLADATTSGERFSFGEEVTAASVDRLIAAVERGATVIEFNSPGGSLEEAIRGHEVLRAADVQTIVTGECASACTILFLGGAERSVETDGRIGVHQWASVGVEADESEAQALSGALVALFKDAGVDEDFFIVGSQTPPQDIRWLSLEEMLAWNVISS